MKPDRFDKAIARTFLFWFGVIILFWLLSVISSCSLVHHPVITIQKEGFVHYASYRVYEDSVCTETMTYTGALEVSKEKVISDYLLNKCDEHKPFKRIKDGIN